MNFNIILTCKPKFCKM